MAATFPIPQSGIRPPFGVQGAPIPNLGPQFLGGNFGIPGGVPGGVPGGFPMPAGFPGMPGMIVPFPPQSKKNLRKEAQFSKGLYVYNFEEITVEILFNHFNKIKPVSVIKFPKTKQRLSKKFAFVYFHSKEDANYVRDVIAKDTEEELKAIQNGATEADLKKLSRRHKILFKAIKVSSLNINEFSKLFLKPRVAATDKVALEKAQKQYFNEANLEKEIKRLIPDARFNRVVVPRDQKNDTALPYARAFFDLENREEINLIKDTLEADENFKKYVEISTYLPFIPTNSNTLYVKGLTKAGEIVDDLTEQLRSFFEKLNPDWKILSIYTSTNDLGAWGNISFDTPEQCREAFEKLRPLDLKFRGNTIYANIKNQADPRAVIIYELKDGVSTAEVNAFFKDVSEKSARVIVPTPERSEEGDVEGEKKEPELRRKFDFFDINILEQREVDKSGESVIIPRRLVITFKDNINAAKLNELIEDISMNENFKKVFNDKFKAKCLRPFKLTGHIDKDSRYIVHKANLNEKRGRDKPVTNKTGGVGVKGKKFGNNPLANIPRGMVPPGGKPNFLGPKSRMPFSGIGGSMMPGGLINPIGKPGLTMPVGGYPSLGNNPLGGNPLGGNPLGGNPLGGNPLGGFGGNPLSGKGLGVGNPLAGNPLAGNPLAGNPLAGNPLASQQRPPQMLNPLANKDE